MDWSYIIFHTLGGLGLFFMGMKVMSESVQKAAGDKLRKILKVLTSNRFVGAFVGFLITAIIQSSGATTVMTIGFVNAGLMTVQQTIGVGLGASIGTTVTGWIVTLNVALYSLPLIGIGVMLRLFSKNKSRQYIGELIYGFGILFLGMEVMKEGFAPLKESEFFVSMFQSIDGTTFASVLLGVLVGIVVTCITQSSSAMVGIVIALASQGLLNFDGALAVVLGSNIGSSSTGVLAAVGGTVNAKRTALAQVIFRSVSVIFLIFLFHPYKELVDISTPGTPEEFITVHIAMGHTLFNVITLIIFIPFVSQLTKFVEKIFPDKAEGKLEMPEDLVKLQTSMFSTPSIAIMECEKELLTMSDYVVKNLDMLREMSLKDPVQVAELTDEIAKNEDRIDKYQYQLTQFLIALSVRAISPGDAKIVASRIGLAHNFEKIADCVEHMAQIIDKLKRNNTTFSAEAINVINQILDENIVHFKKSVSIFKTGEELPVYADEALVIRIRIKKLIKDAKIQHFNRIKEKICDGSASIQFIDILNNLNTMSAENHNVAEVLAGEKY